MGYRASRCEATKSGCQSLSVRFGLAFFRSNEIMQKWWSQFQSVSFCSAPSNFLLTDIPILHNFKPCKMASYGSWWSAGGCPLGAGSATGGRSGAPAVALRKGSQSSLALDLLQQMPRQQVTPNVISYSSAPWLRSLYVARPCQSPEPQPAVVTNKL